MVLRQFDLHLCARGLCTLGEDVEDEACAVQRFDLDSLLDKSDLLGREVIIKDDETDVVFLDKGNDFLNQNLKSQIPKNKIFEINSLIFNITKHKKEILTKYKCFYEEKNNSLNVLLTQNLNFSDFTKEIMLNLLELAQKVGIETIYFLVAKKNPQYIKFVQDLMIIGFEVDTNTKTVNIEGNIFKVLKLEVKDQDDEIEEIF